MRSAMSKKWIVLTVAIIIVLGLGAFMFFRNPGQKQDTDQTLGQTDVNQADESADAKPNMETKTLPDGLQIIDEIVGTGQEALAGNIVSVNYVGTLTNGSKFDSSYDRGRPFAFILGAGQVIKGWDEGVAGMKIGGKRKLIIPPSLGYGAQSMGNGLIPANSTLIFEVELLGIQNQ